MKNKKLLAMTAMVITASVLMSACSFGAVSYTHLTLPTT